VMFSNWRSAYWKRLVLDWSSCRFVACCIFMAWVLRARIEWVNWDAFWSDMYVKVLLGREVVLASKFEWKWFRKKTRKSYVAGSATHVALRDLFIQMYFSNCYLKYERWHLHRSLSIAIWKDHSSCWINLGPILATVTWIMRPIPTTCQRRSTRIRFLRITVLWIPLWRHLRGIRKLRMSNCDEPEWRN